MIVVSGESLLDVFAGAKSGNGMALDAVVGGSPLNLAMGLARLGRPVMFFGAVSRDFPGERIERLVRAEGIAVRLEERLQPRIGHHPRHEVVHQLHQAGLAAEGLVDGVVRVALGPGACQARQQRGDEQ